MTDTFEENPCEEEPVALESTVKAAPRVPGRDKSPGVGEVPMEFVQGTGTESVKLLTRICNKYGTQNNALQAGNVSHTSQSSRKEMPWPAGPSWLEHHL